MIYDKLKGKEIDNKSGDGYATGINYIILYGDRERQTITISFLDGTGESEYSLEDILTNIKVSDKTFHTKLIEEFPEYYL